MKRVYIGKRTLDATRRGRLAVDDQVIYYNHYGIIIIKG